MAPIVGFTSSVETMLSSMSASAAATQIVGFLPFIALFGAALPAVLISAKRRGVHHADILPVPLLLTTCAQFVRLILIGLGQIPAMRVTAYTLSSRLNGATAGPFSLPPDVIAGIVSVLSLALIILLRSNRQSRQQAMLESEIASARGVQQMILPDAVESVPVFRVESVYEPAQEVGGDFFQTISDGAGGMIVTVGDVSRKDLPAAMLVSMLVGAIRSVAESTCAPDVILAHLNRRSTAIAAHISASGAVTIANVGHLAPYLDGRELEQP